MSEVFIGEIRMFAFAFAPRGWAVCDGQEMSIQQNQALASLLDYRYGGDGKKTFRLPDLRGRTPLGVGRSASKRTFRLAEAGGAESVALPSVPRHSHRIAVNDMDASANLPLGNFLSDAREATGAATLKTYVKPVGELTALAPTTLKATGAGDGIDIRQPYLGVTFCIALTGDYPPRGS